MKTFKLERRGRAAAFHGYNDDQTVHVDVCIHLPKNKFMVDIEIIKEGRRIMCEVSDSLSYLIYYTNQTLLFAGHATELVIPDDVRRELEEVVHRRTVEPYRG